MLRSDEKLVADSLVGYFRDKGGASYSEGDDPPDLLFTTTHGTVAVEVSQLLQPVFDASGRSVRTYNETAARVINDLDREFGPLLDDSLCITVGVSVPVRNVAKFKKEIRSWIGAVVENAVLGHREDKEIQNSAVRVAVRPPRRGKKIVGYIWNTKTDPNIGMSASAALRERIVEKHKIWTKHQRGDGTDSLIWLALLNDYWLADLDTYSLAAQQIEFHHCFDKIFVVSQEGEVRELGFQTDGSNSQ